MTRRVVLRDLEDAEGTRYLEARVKGDGALIIEGQDLGNGVRKIFGEGIGEYEWSYIIKKENIPLVIKALGGQEGDDILELITDRCTGEDAQDLEDVIRSNKIPHEFLNWMTE
ncbi:MAG: hypothetical protein MUP98_00035 [Candidatus Aminicenantes bacterium]|nr:hypothetical protein [Candidatus Aminicenantes bacterium]